MGVDYYRILQVDRSATDDDLKAKFKQISEAYDVLIDPQKRAIYDQYGEEGLKGGARPPDAGGPTFFSTGGGGPSSRFNTRNADDIFSELFGSSSPFGGMGGGGPGGGGGMGGPSSRFNTRNADDIFKEFFGSSTSSPSGGMGGGGRGGGGGMRGPRFSDTFDNDVFAPFREGGGSGGPRKGNPIEQKLPCTLEELYNGTTKKMKISREILDASGLVRRTVPVEEILTININPGWKKGTKITFQEKGNELPNQTPSDVVFIIDEKAHRNFTRDGNDLIFTRKISLAEALTGSTVRVPTLYGRTLTIPVNNVIHPNYEEIVAREGMPISKEPNKKGNLKIKFDIKFPACLTSSQKAGIKELLGS